MVFGCNKRQNNGDLPSMVPSFMDLTRRATRIAHEFLNEPLYRQAVQDHPVCDACERICFVHIRKTAGTSLNHMFLSLCGLDAPTIYEALGNEPSHRLTFNDWVFIGWHTRLINRGHYHYAWTHDPWHQLRIPPGTFVFTCLRDPLERVLSLHRMLVEQRNAGGKHPGFAGQAGFLGSGFHDFVRQLPEHELLRQLYTFSDRYDIEEALDQLRTLDHVLVTEAFEAGVETLAAKLQLPLQPLHMRTTVRETAYPSDDVEVLRKRLAPEYEFFNRARAWLKEKAGTTP